MQTLEVMCRLSLKSNIKIHYLFFRECTFASKLLKKGLGRDGNNQMLPISWAVVEKETSDSWKWFLQQLQEDLCIGEGLGWALISDMQKVSQQKKN